MGERIMDARHASVAESLSRAHQALLRDLRRLQDMVRPDSNVSLAELRNCLGATYTHVCEHFRLEEMNGYMEELVKDQPRLQRIVEQLGEDHRALRQSLDALHGEAIVASHVDNALREKVRCWIDRLMQHETRENDLIQEAVDSDFAAQD
jgi:hypothetical protein